MRPRGWKYVVWTALILLLATLACVHLDLSLQKLAAAFPEVFEYLGRYRRPDFADWAIYLTRMGQTLAIGLWGTVLAFVLAAFLGPLAANNFTPHRFVLRPARELLSFMRSLPDLLIALILVSAVGLGPTPGVLALGIHTAGFLGKFFAESLERVDRGVCEAVSATGGGSLQRLMFAGAPSISREVVGYTLYIVDRNVRMATVLGIVGAGGIGTILYDKLKLFEYRQAAAIILVILVTIVVIDYLSTWLRKALS